MPSRGRDEGAAARAWHHHSVGAMCDVQEPWAFGMVMRASRYPTYWDYNVVRAERHPDMSAQELVAFADEALAGLAHRRIDFELADQAEPVRADLTRLGWMTSRLVWMRHTRGPRPHSEIRVRKVDFDAVNDLRARWHHEDFPSSDLASFESHLPEAREVAVARGVEVFAVYDADTPIAFSENEWSAGSAEIVSVYVDPEHRGRGLGTALTCAAIEAARDADDLWIVADDEGRPKELYARLGFEPEWAAIQTLRLPAPRRQPSDGRSPIQ